MDTKHNFRILLPLATLMSFVAVGALSAQEQPTTPPIRSGATGATGTQNIDDCVNLYNQRSYPEAERACRDAINNARGKYTQALAHYDLGIVLYAEGKFEDAVKEYDQASSLRAGESDTYFGRGVSLYQLNRKDEAMTDFTHSINLNSQHAGVFLDRGMVWTDRGVAAQDPAERTADFYNADKDFTQALHMNPGLVNAWVNRAEERRVANNTEGAKHDYEEALKLTPADPASYYSRATLLYKDGKLDDAAKDFDNSIRLNPYSSAAYYDLGATYQQMASASQAKGAADAEKSALDKAAQNYRMAVKTGPQNKDAYFNLADVEFKQGQYQDSANDFTQALKSNADWGDALTGRALAYEKLPDPQWQAAIDDLSKVNPMTPRAHYALGVAYSGQNNFEKAVAEYKLALGAPEASADAKEKLDVAEVYYGLGVAHQGQGKVNEAIDDYTSALGRRPEYEDALRQRGGAYDDAKNWEAALKDLQAAQRLNANDPGVADGLGRAYLGKQDYPNAMASFNKEISLKPTADAHLNLGVAYYQSGDPETAIKHFNDSLSPGMNNKEPWLAYLDRSAAERRLALPSADADLEQGLKLAPPGARAQYEAQMNPDFARLAREGHDDFEKRDYAGASIAYAGAIHDSSTDPQDAWQAYYGKGLSELDSDPKRLTEAVADFQKALELRHDPYPEGHNALGSALKEQGLASNDASLLAAAEQEFRKAKDQSKQNPAKFDQASVNLAETLLAEKKWAEAAAAYQEVKAKKNDAAVWDGSALALYHTGHYQESVNDFNAAIHLYSQKTGASAETADAYVGLGDSYAQLDQWSDAQAAYQEAANRKPGDEGILLDLAFAKVALNNTPGAMREYRKAIAASRQANGPDGKPYYDLANLEIRRHRLAAALSDSRQALLLSKGEPYAYDLRGVAEGDAHSYSSARRDFETALMRKQDDPDLHFNRAMSLIPTSGLALRVRHERWEAVRGELQAVLNSRSNDAEAHYYSGLADLYLGSHDAKGRATKNFSDAEFQNALNDFKAAAQSPKYAKQAHLHLSDLHRYKNEVGDAKSEFSEAVSADADAKRLRNR